MSPIGTGGRIAGRYVHGPQCHCGDSFGQELGQGKTVVTVASDTGLKYMNGKLLQMPDNGRATAGTTLDLRLNWNLRDETPRPLGKRAPRCIGGAVFWSILSTGQGRFMIVPTSKFHIPSRLCHDDRQSKRRQSPSFGLPTFLPALPMCPSES